MRNMKCPKYTQSCWIELMVHLQHSFFDVLPQVLVDPVNFDRKKEHGQVQDNDFPVPYDKYFQWSRKS